MKEAKKILKEKIKILKDQLKNADDPDCAWKFSFSSKKSQIKTWKSELAKTEKKLKALC